MRCSHLSFISLVGLAHESLLEGFTFRRVTEEPKLVVRSGPLVLDEFVRSFDLETD